MHGQARGLVECEDRVVLVEHVEVEGDVRFFERGAHEDDRLAGPNTLAGPSAGSIGAIRACLHDLLRAGARQSWNPMLNEPVQALTGVLRRNREREEDGGRVATRGKRGLGASTRP
jgi:hypothetical protein